jgi:hypothetical protein
MNNTIKLTDKENEVLGSIYRFTLSQNHIDRKNLKLDDLDWLIKNARAYIDALDINTIPATSDMSMKVIGGVLTSLQGKGLIYVADDVGRSHGYMQFVITQDGMKHCIEQK